MKSHSPKSVKNTLEKLEHAQQTHAQKAAAQNSSQISKKNEVVVLGNVIHKIVVQVIVENVERDDVFAYLLSRSVLRERLVEH